MDIKTAVIYRLNDLIKQKDITVNEAAVRSGVPPSTLKNILYGQSRNAGVVTIKKICDGLDITIQEFLKIPSSQIWNRSYRNRQIILGFRFCKMVFYGKGLEETNTGG